MPAATRACYVLRVNKLLCIAISILLTGIAPTAHARKMMVSPASAAVKTHIVANLTTSDANATIFHRTISSSNSVILRKQLGCIKTEYPIGNSIGEAIGYAILSANEEKCPVRAAIEDDAAAMYDKLSIDIPTLAMQALASANVPIELLEDGAVKVFPSLTLVSVNEVNMLFEVGLKVDYPVEGKKKARGEANYSYQLRTYFSRARIASGLDASDLATLRRDAAEGFAELAWLYAADSRGELPSTSPIRFYSQILFPDKDIPFEGELIAVRRPGRYMVRMRYQVFSFPAGRVRIY